MARKKEYIREVVLEKAMNLFWLNGYETTSMHMLEKEMGINKFSIYSSFGNKNNLFIESIKHYKKKLEKLIAKLKLSKNGVNGIKNYFFDIVDFTKETEFRKGCLIANTANDIDYKTNENIKKIISEFAIEIKQLFKDKLKDDKTKDKETIEKQADYLLIAMFGLSSATKIFSKEQIENYIKNIFLNI